MPRPAPSPAPGARLMRFLDHERRHRLHGSHRAVHDLRRRTERGENGARLRQFLRIERGRSA